MPRHDPIHTVFQSNLLRVIDHRCAGREDAREEIPQDFEIVVPRAGAYQRRDAHGAFLADPNQVVFFNRGEAYDISHPIQGGDASTVFVIAPLVLYEMAREHSLDPGDDRRIFSRSHIAIDSRLQCLQYHLLPGGETLETLEIEEEILAAVGELFHALQQAEPVQRAPTPPTWRAHAEQVGAVKTYLNANLGARLKLEDISAAVHLSPYHLCRIFKRETGMTLHQYVKRLRLFNAAERILEYPVARLDEVALDFGFANHGHFSVAFQHMFGINPSKFRNPRFRQLSKNLKA